MSDYVIKAIDPAQLATIRADGEDAEHNPARCIVAESGGDQLRCCLRRSRPGEEIMLISHAPLERRSPWREVGPVWVHAQECPGRPDSPDVPGWFDDGSRVLRAYTRRGEMHYPANRLVRAGESDAAGLDLAFADPEVAEVHIRNLVAQCFIARAVRVAQQASPAFHDGVDDMADASAR